MEREGRKEQSAVWGMISSYWEWGLFQNKAESEARWQRIKFIIMYRWASLWEWD